MTTFEDQYIQLRAKENRIYKDDQVSRLPFLKNNEAHAKEWLLRAKTAKRFKQYLEIKENNLSVLDLGCGNGWFTNYCFQASTAVKAIGIEINQEELTQAKRVFEKPHLSFYHWNVFENPPFQENIDVITLNAVIQYFEHPKKLFKRLAELLKPEGEIHILDSPFYPDKSVKAAAERSSAYYLKMGFPKMADFYFHHSLSEVEGFKLMKKAPNGIIRKLLKSNEPPFNWYRIKKKELI